MSEPPSGPALACAAAWLATTAVVKLAFPGWGIAWTGLPLQQGWGPFLGACLVMAAAYPAVLLALRVITPADLRLLRQLVGRGEPAPGP